MLQKLKDNRDLINAIWNLHLEERSVSRNERIEGWKKLVGMAEGDEDWLAKIDIARKFIDDVSFPFKRTIPSWAKEGIDYMIIPDGTRYRFKDINLTPPKRNMFGRFDFEDYRKEGPSTVYDYTKEQLLPNGRPRAEWNGGVGMIFDGENVLLTCNQRLFNETKESVGARQGGLYIYFYNATQHAFFDDFGMDMQFRTVICNAEDHPYHRNKEAPMNTLYYQFHEKAGVKDPSVPYSPSRISIISYEQRTGELFGKFVEYDKEQQAVENQSLTKKEFFTRVIPALKGKGSK